jgi:acetolactate synthase-1/2/3 large subunit
MATLCGFSYSKRIIAAKDLEEALDGWLSTDGPAFLEVITDRSEVLYPVVRPGSSYKQMELGPYIKKIT